MPTELSHMVGMHDISDFPSSLTARLLHKGPEYLRKQMEAAKPSRKSAVERLAADKAKYVKSQQVISRKQVPAISLSSASESSSSSSETCSEGSKKAELPREEKGPAATELSPAAPQGGPPIVRRNSGKRQIRPDSLVIYRQKCEFVRGQSQENPRGSLVRRLFQGPFKEKQPVSEVSKVVLKEETTPEVEGTLLGKDTGHSHELEGQNSPAKANPMPFPASRCKNALNGPSPPYDAKEMRQKGLQRSQSDISSRYSKSFSEFETFFKNCGLEPEVIKDLGQENFSVASDNFSFHLHSVNGAASESDFTRPSDEEGLLEEELPEQAPSGTSVVERNARIIKWLYMCKKAREAHVAVQGLA
ncbi:protein FAM110C [Thamnophis elegans]|uniref:protein FAM110C n=1 Tax=Thamnophis elegans TaxID=35005 RepID=UPI00137778A8|nr:protein FAM110C [Thamnophis elegans]